MPGHAYANVRQPPVSTLNLAHMIPLSAVWAGPARAMSISRRRRCCSARPRARTPFRLSLHVGDVGHTLIVGPTGSGQIGPAFADGDAVPALPQQSDLRLRLRRLDPHRGRRHGRRLARPRGQPLRRVRAPPFRYSRWRGSTIRPNAPGPPNGWRRSLRRKASPSIRPPRSISGRR